MSLNHNPAQEYKSLFSKENDPDDDEDYPPYFHTSHMQEQKSQWSHIEDLDQFFNRVYQYHQNNGIYCLILMEFLNLIQILFLAIFSTYVINCVNYTILFKHQEVVEITDKNESVIVKRTLHDIVYPLNKCISKFNVWIWSFLIFFIIFWSFRLIKAIYNIARYLEIKTFYAQALQISTNEELSSITWNEILIKLLHVQKKHHLCIHKQELTELEVYNRILRFKNYEVAMINKLLLPPRLNLPLLGELVLFTNNFKLNFEFILFWGPFAPFKSYQLKPEYKVTSKRVDLARDLAKWSFILGLCNLLLAPVIFVWQLLQFFYNYTELIKRDPGLLGTRKWSNYGRLYLRHFNELDHELDSRLSKAYRPSATYTNSFISKPLVVLANFLLITFGALFAVLVVLTIIDEDVLNVEHVLTIITASGAIAGIARSLIPSDEQTVYLIDELIYQILAHVHYMPDSWKANPRSSLVRAEFSKLFQYKFVYLIEELLSPLITPFLLIIWTRRHSLEIIDFLRNFTIDVAGIGDVCSFSQMDTQRHGNPRWLSQTKAKPKNQCANGKIELSLINFTHTNPKWKAPKESTQFLDRIKEHVEQDVRTSQNTLGNSLYHVSKSLQTSNTLKSSLSTNVDRSAASTARDKQTLLAIAQASTLQTSGQSLMPVPPARASYLNPIENSVDMSFSALYMHELHRKYYHGEYINLESLHEESNRSDQESDNEDNNDHDGDQEEETTLKMSSYSLASNGTRRNINQIV